MLAVCESKTCWCETVNGKSLVSVDLDHAVVDKRKVEVPDEVITLFYRT